MSSEHHDLADIPEGAILRSVTAQPSSFDHRRAVQVSLSDKVSHDGVAGVDYVDQPTFVQVPTTFTTGMVSVDIVSRLRPDAPEDARGFAGIAYRIGPGEKPPFEAVYLRPTNGSHVAPIDGPRRLRASNTSPTPSGRTTDSRDERPHGGYEAAADIRLSAWTRLQIIARATSISAAINGTRVLDVPRLSSSPCLELWDSSSTSEPMHTSQT